MIENLEIKLVAGLARKESRGTHYREDYPMRDEANFSGWNTVHNVNGVPTVTVLFLFFCYFSKRQAGSGIGTADLASEIMLGLIWQ